MRKRDNVTAPEQGQFDRERMVVLADRLAISDAITGLLHAVDRRDWTTVGTYLAPQVQTDYTSLFGGSPHTQTSAELVAGWRAFVPGFDATLHLTGPILADVVRDAARARCAVRAIHSLGQDHWIVSGHYEMELSRTSRGWVISAIGYENVLVSGDRTLPERAQARARDASNPSRAD
jgi:hypothetical protein